MKYAKKMLGGEGDKNIDGLISSLKKSSPGTLAAIELGGGRIRGHAMAKDASSESPNSSRIMQQKKIC